jgi:hypothetical protein
VTSLSNGNTYGYDANGNMTTRVIGGSTYNLTIDAECRLVSVSGAATASIVYDGNGKRVLTTVDEDVKTAYIGSYFEWDVPTESYTRYYFAGSTRIAIRQGESDPVWLLGDHLGSTSVVYDETTAEKENHASI